MNDQLKEFWQRLHKSCRLISVGHVTYLNHKDVEVTLPAILVHHGIYDQTWAWQIDAKGKISNVHDMWFTAS
jgi:hypothetical protein